VTARGPDKPGAGSPFAALASLRDALPTGPAPTTTTKAAAPVAAKDDPFRGKIVIAKTRKGRGGKTVTAVRGIAGTEDELSELARELARALGCGAVLDGDQIVVQGEQQERVRAFLAGRGAKRIVIGT
jgi:translation initiation factor 1